MKKILFTLLALLLLTSCGPSGNQFRLAGRLRNINQGQFLVYSPDGAFAGIDTIKVQNGRFAYEKEVRKDITLMLVFPNFSEQAVFASPGEEVEIKGDATHLKEMTITGTDENDELTKLRIRLNKLTPPEITAAVAEYIQEEPSSMISIYLLDKYFVNAKTPDYAEAQRLATLMLKANPDNGRLHKLKKQLDGLKNSRLQAMLPVVSSTDINGKSISTSQVKGKIGVISTWATWNFPSTDIQRKLRKLQKQYPQELSLISICIDGDKRECKKRVDRDSLLWTIVCDEQMFQTPIVQQLGLFVVPSMVVTNKQGKIVARDIEPNKVVEELEKFLK
jgi:hypothetical protein